MDKWEILKQKTIEAGSNNFIEISTKKLPDNKTILFGISKGWYTPDKQKKYKSNILFSKEKKDEIIQILSEMD